MTDQRPGQRPYQLFVESFKGEVVSADDALQLAEKLAADVAQWLQRGVDQRGAATLVVSGGSTPAPFFSSLSQHEIAWSEVTVTLADERWVDSNNDISNEKLVRETLLINAASDAKFTSLFVGTDSPQNGWPVCEQGLQSLSRPFDVVVLGMGGDGHTASLFPNTDGLSDACDLSTDKLCWPMYPNHLDEARMTLTLKALLDCRELVLHMTGVNKRDVFNRALQGEDFPIGTVAKAAEDKLQVYWTA